MLEVKVLGERDLDLKEEEDFRLLTVGGSTGGTFLSKIMRKVVQFMH